MNTIIRLQSVKSHNIIMTRLYQAFGNRFIQYQPPILSSNRQVLTNRTMIQLITEKG